jgi:hypothetical protein
MLYFRSCPRCRLGTVELTGDFDGPSLTCLNCAYTIVGRDHAYSREPREQVVRDQSLPRLMFGVAAHEEAGSPEPLIAMEQEGPAAAAV